MHIHWIDPYSGGDSLLHQLDARIKLVLVILYILVASLMPVGAWPAYGLLFLFVLVATRVSGLSLGRVQRRALIALPFALAAATVIFTSGGETIFTLSLGRWQLSATVPGLVRFFSIVLKSWLSVQIAILLASTTRFPDLVAAMRALHFPKVLVAIVSFMWRYIFVLADEALRLIRARDARSAVVPGLKSGGRLTWRARVAGGMAGNLFLRSYERSERIYQAMVARGYQGEWRTWVSPELAAADRAMGLVAAAYLVLVLVGGVLVW